MELLLDPSIWASFLTLAALEIVLGIDNLLFIAVVVMGGLVTSTLLTLIVLPTIYDWLERRAETREASPET